MDFSFSLGEGVCRYGEHKKMKKAQKDPLIFLRKSGKIYYLSFFPLQFAP